MSKRLTRRQAAEEAAKAHTDLTMFYSVIALLEGGHLYCPKSHRAAERIIQICKAEAHNRLIDHDRAIDALERAT